MKQHFKLGLVALTSILATSAFAATDKGEVNIYSYRQAYLIMPILEQFEKDTGIKVNFIYADKGLVQRVISEKEQTPADILLTVDISRVMEIVKAGLAQPIKSEILEKNIPSQYRDSGNQWFAMTTRVRAVYSSKDRVGKLPASFSYLDLADPKYKGLICTRSGKHVYNISLVASVIAHEGEAKAKEWLKGVKANLARKPQGNDRDQIKAISAGICDYSFGNSYYYGKMLTDPKQKPAADDVYINFPNQESYGTNANISGVAVAKFAKNKENAIKLLEYLSGEKAQHEYAEFNHEYPVNPKVKPSKLVASWGEFKADTIPLETIAANHEKALKLIDEVKFDL